MVQVSGDPKKKFALPIGWVKFPLRQQRQQQAATAAAADNAAEAENPAAMWHTAYHGTEPGWVRRTLHTGQLLTKGEVGLEQRRGRGGKEARSKEDDSDISLLHFSPTINYAGLERFSPGKRFTDKRQQRGHVARVALQVAVGPGSYKAGETQVTTAETRTIGHHIHKSNVYCLL